MYTIKTCENALDNNLIVNSNTKRNISLDIVRVVAIFCVLLVHIAASFYDTNNANTFEFYIGVIFNSIGRLAVPFFCMISGALILDEKKDFDVKTFVFKRIKNIAVVLFIWIILYATVYSIILPLINGQKIDITNFALSLVYEHYHLWYLYMILGLYAVTPILRLFVKKENSNYILVILILFFILQAIPQIFTLIATIYLPFNAISLGVNSLADGFLLKFDYLFYYLLGWYVIRVGISKTVKIISYVISLICIITIILYVVKYIEISCIYDHLGFFIVCYSFGVFNLLTSIKVNENKNNFLKKSIVFLSKNSFGVYLIHVFILDLLLWLLPYKHLPILYILGIFILLSLISYALCYPISKIPYLKKIIRA